MLDSQSYYSQLPDSALPPLRPVPTSSGVAAAVPDASMHRRPSITYETLPTPAMSLGCLERKKKGARRIWTHALEKFLFTPHEMFVLL